MSSTPRLPIVIVGLSFGRHILTLLQKPETSRFFELAGVCDLRPDVTRELADKYKVKAYSSLQEVLDDPAVPLVGLFTQPRGRAALLNQILDAGKDILTTKPFELDAGEAEKVLRKAQTLGRVLYVNSPSPELAPDVAQIVAWRDQFDLGRLISARGEVWASYFEKADGSWMDDPAMCPGGAMMRLGIYLINDILSLAGPVEEIQFIGDRIRTGRPTPDNALLSLRLGGGCLATVFASFCIDDGDQYPNGLILNYERGTIYRNIGQYRPVAGNVANLSLIMKNSTGRVVAAETSIEGMSGEYPWAGLHQAVSRHETLDEAYLQRVVQGVKVLQFLRDHPTKISSFAGNAAPVPA